MQCRRSKRRPLKTYADVCYDAVPPLEKATSQDIRRPPASVPVRTAGTVGGLLGDDLSLSQVLHTSAYVSIRQHTSAYVGGLLGDDLSLLQVLHTSAYVSIRQHQHAYAVPPQLGDDLSLSQVLLLLVYGAVSCIRQHTSLHASAYARRRPLALAGTGSLRPHTLVA